MAKIKERAKQAVQANYNCKGEYPCSNYKNCVFGCGTNTAYDCEECGADEFEVGYLKGSAEQRKIDIEKACEEFNAFVDKVMSEKFEREWCAAAKIRFRQNLEE